VHVFKQIINEISFSNNCAYQLYRKVLDIHFMAANFQSS